MKLFFLISLFFQLLIYQNLTAQSVLLIRSNTTVYDTYRENKVAKLTLKEDTWVNYKGKYGDYFKISNFFGKDEYYPVGIFEGFVSINAVLDTASRNEYENNIHSVVDPDITSLSKKTSPQTNALPVNLDIDNYYLGMSHKDAVQVGKSSLKIKNYIYQIQLRYNASIMLSSIEVLGEKKDALAVDGLIKMQLDELGQFLYEKYGYPSEQRNYPSFLEIEEGGTFNIATWILPDKKITLGLSEKNNLFYSRMVFQEN